LSETSAALITFGLLIISLSIHEAAHAWTSNRLGDPTARQLGRITLNPMAHIDWIGTVLFPLLAYMSNLPLIGWAKPVPVDIRNLRAPRRDFAIVAAAGPASNLLQAAAAAGVLAALFDPSSMEVAARILRYFIYLNVSLAVFNLIPIPPLDGGNMLAGILPEQFARMFDQLRSLGFILLYVLMFAGVFRRFVYPVSEAIYNVLVPIY
jgi:Zn-dependent protease